VRQLFTVKNSKSLYFSEALERDIS
jgi:hypothetical protein